MSFSVSVGDGRLEWAGSNLATVFAQPRNLLRPRFLGMLSDILRFNREATAALAGAPEPVTLGCFLERGHYGHAFRDWYLLPMAAAIWSCPRAAMLDYPFATFARFCHNHGLWSVGDRPQWRTVAGGGREYVRRMLAALPDVRLKSAVERVRRTPAGVLVESSARPGHAERFDAVVLACHSDQALALIDAPSVAERSALAAVGWQPNTAWLHTDTSLMPRRRRTWSAWNYLAPEADCRDDGAAPVAVSYLVNKLQPLPFATPVMVTLNPPRAPREATVLARFEYAHPVFDAAAIAAQGRLPGLQGRDGLWFAGAWTGFGFHEDGLRSGLAAADGVARHFGASVTARAA